MGVRTLSCAQRYHRAAVVEHTSGCGLLWVEWGEVVAKTDKGEGIALPFATWEGDLSELNQETAFRYLATEPLLLPYDVDTLAWEYELYGCGLEELVARGTFNVTVEVELVDAKGGLPLAVVHRTPLSRGTAESRVAGRVAAEASGYRGLEVFLRVCLRGFADKGSGTTASVGEVFIIENPLLEGGVPKARPPLAGQATVPIVFSLAQNYPNPCNPTTEIRYQLPEQCSVRLRVYNLMGQEVMRLVDKVEGTGMHVVRWDGKDALGRELASGVYIYRLEAGGLVASRKLALVRRRSFPPAGKAISVSLAEMAFFVIVSARGLTEGALVWRCDGEACH